MYKHARSYAFSFMLSRWSNKIHPSSNCRLKIAYNQAQPVTPSDTAKVYCTSFQIIMLFTARKILHLVPKSSSTASSSGIFLQEVHEVSWLLFNVGAKLSTLTTWNFFSRFRQLLIILYYFQGLTTLKTIGKIVRNAAFSRELDRIVGVLLTTR